MARPVRPMEATLECWLAYLADLEAYCDEVEERVAELGREVAALDDVEVEVPCPDCGSEKANYHYSRCEHSSLGSVQPDEYDDDEEDDR